MKTLITRSIASLLLILAMAVTSYAQTTTTESFDGATFPPTGWTTSSSSSLSWSRVTAGVYPTCAPQSGVGMAKCNSYDYSSGTALLITPVIDYSLRGGNTPTVSFWMYRDNGYSTDPDRIEVYVNTTNTTTGGTSLGVVNRSRSLAPVVATDGWYQYSFNIPVAFSGTTNYLIFSGTTAYGDNMYMDDVVYTSYPAVPGTVTGFVSNGFGVPINAATVTVGALTTTTAGNGSYTFIAVPPGTYSMTASAPSFNPSTVTGVLVTGGVTTYQNFTLHRPAIAVTPNPFNVTVNPNELYTENMTIANGGDGELTWTASIAYPPGDSPVRYPARNPQNLAVGNGDNSLNRSQYGDPQSDAPNAFGDILSSFAMPFPPIELGWGVGFDGSDIWVSSYYDQTLYQLSTTGAIMNSINCSSWLGGNWIGDLANSPGYLYAVQVGGDNGIKKINTSTGVVEATITGAWAGVSSARGLAYDAQNDEFWIGGWNYTQIYHVSGTGAAISSIPFSGVSGLAWHPNGNGGTGSLWVSVNAATSFVYELDPATGNVIQSFAVPGPSGYTGAGLEIDNLGNLWVMNQTNQTLYNVDSGEPLSVSGWLSLDTYLGTVAPYTNFSLPANFNASGIPAGTVKTATVTFVSSPDVGTVDIPVTMTVQGATLGLPTDLTAILTNALTGTVALNWSYVPSGTLINFVVKRDGVQVGTTLLNSFADVLPTYGIYNYTVQAVYAEGLSSPAGPEEVEWPNPTMMLDPTSLYDELWINTSAVQHLTINNTGEGTLSFSFPEWAGDHLLNTPGLQHNNVSNPFEGMNVNFGKDEFDPTAGGGYPPVMGAGGPDPYGYTWIDSDEAGGPTYSWVDISATGTAITGLSDDNNVGPFNIGWNFPYYGTNFGQFWVNSNGTIAFNSTYIGLSNYAIPNTSYSNYIAWMWDDMDPGNANSHIYYKNMGSYLVIQFMNYYRYPDGGPYVDAEMILYPDGHILMQYANLAGGITTNSCSVGMQGPSSTDGLQVAYNATYLHNGLAVWMGLPAPSFITAVVPASGTVPAGGSKDIQITFTSTGFDPGTYTEDLNVTSNDLAHLSVDIPCTMVVYVPGGLDGTVTDAVTGAPLPGVTVTAGAFVGMTGDDGTYSMNLDAGTYNVNFAKIGYQSATVDNQVVVAGSVTTVDAQLYETPYAPNTVVATVNATDTQCDVVWNQPEGPYEILYDDGTAENFAAWQQPGNMNAVKFTPMGYPAVVVGGKFFVGDGSFPAGGNIMGAAFGVSVKLADGPGGMPGTTVDSVEASVTNLGWVTVEGLNAVIASGDFYLVMTQGSVAPNCAPIGVDQTQPSYYKSYSRNIVAGGAWALSPYQDLMMHAIVVGAAGGGGDKPVASSVKLFPVKQRGMISMIRPLAIPGLEGKSQYAPAQGFETDAMDHYKIWRLSEFDPSGPVSAGTFTALPDAVVTSYTDGGAIWAGLPQGWYAYGVAAVYPNGDVSDTIYSNIVGHKFLVSVTVNVSLTTGGSPAGAIVTLTGSDYPYEVYTATVPASGQVIFDGIVWKGNYTLYVHKGGFTDYLITANITTDRIFNVILEEMKYKPRNLYVDDLTLVATWYEPLSIIVDEDFEGATFPPDGWQSVYQSSIGWFASTDGGSAAFVIPTHTTYAVSNDDAPGSSNNGCCDYLIMPPADLTNAPSYVLSFQSYYDGSYSQSALVEMSTDAGATWEVIDELSANPGSWTQIDVDLSAYSGPTGLNQVWFAFHAQDNGQWGSGWAVDDVVLYSGGLPVQGYAIFLDGALVYQPIPELTYTFDPATINYGQTYEAGVAGIYSSGFSELDTYRFTSRFLYPPINLTGLGVDNAAFLDWEGPGGGGGGAGGSLTEDFELGITPDGWEIITTNTNIGGAGVPATWTVTDYASADIVPFGTYHCGLWWDYSHQDEWLISPEIACGATTTLSFETSVYEGSTYLDHYYVKVSTDGGTNWDVVWDASTLSGGAWNYYAYPYSIDLSAYAGQDIKIAWNAVDGDGQGLWYVWFVDNIAVASGDGMMRIPASSLTHKGLSENNAQRHDAIARDGNMAAIAGSQRSVLAPAGLIGYNLYRDDAQAAYIEAPTTEYWDLNLAPATYCYDVTAVYDLTAYGFTGTGESMKEGTVCVDVNYGYPLPFVEDWTTGNFNTNQWTVGDNWRIAGQMGNPMPSAEFGWDPPQADYALSLESYYINSSLITTATPYKIWFDFDLALDDRTATSNEKMAAEVWTGSAWVKVAEFVNNGDLAFAAQHIDITTKAKERVFKVRFLASGTASTDIYYWLVDNIHIYVEYEFAPAINLVTNVTGIPGNDVHLVWEAPAGAVILPGTWIHYDDGVNADAIGTGAAADFNVAIRFDVSQLAEYDGMAVKKIKFFPNEPACSYSVRVWTGDNAANLVVDQPVASPVIGDWNEIDLTDFAMIDASQELWIGVRCNTTTGYPAGCDAGPAVAGYGDLITLDGVLWESISQVYGLDYNWNVQGFVEGVGDSRLIPLKPIKQSIPLTTTLGTIKLDPNYSATAANLVQRTTTDTRQIKSTSDLTGYNVYRINEAGDTTMIANTTATEYDDLNLEVGCYDWFVTAVYNEGESVPSNVEAECIIGINEVTEKDVNIYPNPATTSVTIVLTNNVRNLTVYNYLGSVVAEKNITKEKSIVMNTSNYAAGAYTIRFTTENGETFSKKLVIIK
jgi:hypothetical protein